jgi:hypothetical protein
MVGRTCLAALAACACVCAASAQEATQKAGQTLDLGMLHWIRDTVCTSDEQILFIPVSNDVPTRELTYAVVPAGHLDTITAHIVTREQRIWLTGNGCSTDPVAPRQVTAQLTSGESGQSEF